MCENNHSDTSSPSSYFTLLPHGTVSPEYFFLNLKPCPEIHSLKTPPADCLEETRASKRRRNCRGFIREEPDQRKTLAGKTETIHQTDSVDPKHVCVCVCAHSLLFSPSAEQIQVDFVEMLRVRDEKRRQRHVEALRRQKLEEDQPDSGATGGGRITRAQRPEDPKNEDQGDQVFSPATTSPKPPSPLKTASKSPNSSTSGSPGTDTTHRQVRRHHWVHKIFVFRINYYYYFLIK